VHKLGRGTVRTANPTAPRDGPCYPTPYSATQLEGRKEEGETFRVMLVLYLSNCLYLSSQVFSLLPSSFSPPLHRGERASGCVGLSCPLGFTCNTYCGKSSPLFLQSANLFVTATFPTHL